MIAIRITFALALVCLIKCCPRSLFLLLTCSLNLEAWVAAWRNNQSYDRTVHEMEAAKEVVMKRCKKKSILLRENESSTDEDIDESWEAEAIEKQRFLKKNRNAYGVEMAHKYKYRLCYE